MTPATHLDLYQLTSLLPHWDAGRARLPVTMSFFARRLPRNADREPTRGYLLWVGLWRCMEWLEQARFDDARIETLRGHPVLGPGLKARPDLTQALRAWQFSGHIDAPREGTPIWAGQAVDSRGRRVDIDGVRPAAQTPFLVVQTDLLGAKLIETPLLSIINHMTMVASKASRVVEAAGDRAVLEFGSRRTHPQEAVDAALAAYVAGCAGSSNVEAQHRHGVPTLGTMDHFAIQAWERAGVPRHETERAYFKAFHEAFPAGSVLLIDTYDTFGEQTGIRNAVAATDGELAGIRIDAGVTVENVKKARALLDSLGAKQARIVVSGGMDEYKIRNLAEAPIDAFGVGERIVTSPDSPVGVGAVGKLCEIDGRPTMKLARGSNKATLPGRVQVFRHQGVDTVACWDETLPGEPLLTPVWTAEGPLAPPPLESRRAYAMAAVRALPASHRTPRQVQVPISDALYRLVEAVVKEQS